MSLQTRKSRGFSLQTIRFCGILFLAAGTIGRIMIRLLFPTADLLADVTDPQAMANSTTMGMAVVSLLLVLIEGCAIPVFCFLLVEGFHHTTDVKKYFLRLLGTAALAELPYNLAISGKVIDLSSRNPVFGMVLCLAMLMLYKQFEAKGIKNFLIKAFVTLFALVWANMFRVLGSCAAMFLTSAFSMFYLVAPVAFLMVHSYNGEQGEGNKLVNYLVYPVMLLAFGLAAIFFF